MLRKTTTDVLEAQKLPDNVWIPLSLFEQRHNVFFLILTLHGAVTNFLLTSYSQKWQPAFQIH